ncbi:MAG: ketol-acid reductoisomerase [Candidatus Krumholzibacteria bacterium]|nr:ketol-acid reductoisomerase [Candidatus Krumholzibacteria bacterium]
MNVYTQKDAEPSVLEGKRIVVAGYGNQGRPQALNLRESGFDVEVAARPGGRGWESAVSDGFRVLRLDEAASGADLLLLLLPDEVQGKVFTKEIDGNLRAGSALCFAHGFAVTFGEIETSEYDLLLVAPKGQGRRLREAYLEGTGLPCLLAVDNDVSGQGRAIALSVAWGLGCLRVGAFETTFREEAVSDLFGEQSVLCGGVPALVKCAFDVLVRRGFSPEVAYFECFHELKIIVDLCTRYGLSGMRDLISGTAAYGSLRFGEDLITDETREAMERLFDRIDSGEFAREWLGEAGSGSKGFERLREDERKLVIEQVGERIRRMLYLCDD